MFDVPFPKKYNPTKNSTTSTKKNYITLNKDRFENDDVKENINKENRIHFLENDTIHNKFDVKFSPNKIDPMGSHTHWKEDEGMDMEISPEKQVFNTSYNNNHSVFYDTNITNQNSFQNLSDRSFN